MIRKSPAAKSLTQQQILSLIHQCQDSNSPIAQRIYLSLITEKEKYKNLRQEFLISTNRLYLEYNQSLDQLRTTAVQDALSEVEQKTQAVEAVVAQEMLKQINNQQ